MARFHQALSASLCAVVFGAAVPNGVLVSPTKAQSRARSVADLTHAWQACVDRTAHRNYEAGQNKSTGVENAFISCGAEEEAIYAASPNVSYEETHQKRIEARMTVKQAIAGQ